MPMDACAAVLQQDLEAAAADDGGLELADLVALGQVRVKVVLAVEHRAPADVGADAQAEHHRVAHDLLIQYRQRARHGQVDRAGLGVGLGAEGGGRAGKYLGTGGQLQVYFQADDGFPLHQLASSCRRLAGAAGASRWPVESGGRH